MTCQLRIRRSYTELHDIQNILINFTTIFYNVAILNFNHVFGTLIKEEF